MGNDSRLLLVEDQRELSGLLEKYLTRAGYAVDCCEQAAEALRRFESKPDQYPLVIADLTLPDMPGQRMVERMLKLQPKLGVLLCSGYPFSVSALAGVDPRRAEFLLKPFSPQMLADAVARILKGAARGEQAAT